MDDSNKLKELAKRLRAGKVSTEDANAAADELDLLADATEVEEQNAGQTEKPAEPAKPKPPLGDPD